MELIIIPAVIIIFVLWLRGRAKNRKFIHAIRIGAARNNADKLKMLGATDGEIQRAMDRDSYKADHQYDYSIGLFVRVKGDRLKFNKVEAPVAGAKATLDYGVDLDGSGRNTAYVNVVLADGRHLTERLGTTYEHKARRLVNAINNASNYYSAKVTA